MTRLLAASILAALDRKDDAVAALREWLNLGGRIDADVPANVPRPLSRKHLIAAWAPHA